MTSLPAVAGTLQTDPRSGGIKRSSGVNVLPCVAEAWAEVRDDSNTSVDWTIVGYDGNSKTDITVKAKGCGGMEACSAALPVGQAVFGGCRLENGRFVTFFYADDETPTMQKGRASMHKNGVLNVLEGSDGEIDMNRGVIEQESLPIDSGVPPVSNGGGTPQKPVQRDELPPLETNLVTESWAASPPKPFAEPIANPSDEGWGEEASESATVSYKELRGITDPSKLPHGVDPLNRELALSDEEFVDVFGMDKDSFKSLAGWKRTSLKKKHGLF